MKPTTWFDALHACQTGGQSYVLITVLTTAGSTPREGGTKMVVTTDSQFDTIGGGHLEYLSISKARQFLLDGQQTQHVESFPLAAKLGQCCGGAMKVFFEVQVNHTQHLAVFGMGHVAQALVPILAQLPLQIRWIDERSSQQTSMSDSLQALLPKNVSLYTEEDSIAEMASLPENSWAIILTHNHQLDYELVEQGLKHGQLDYLGMIGSDTKAERFRLRLHNRGFSQSHIEFLTSPIGNRSIPGKRPIEVAVSISAQIIERLNHAGVDNTAKANESIMKKTSDTETQ